MDSIAACQHEEILASFTYKTYESENRSFCVFRFKNYDTKKEFTAVGSMLPDSRNVLTGSNLCFARRIRRMHYRKKGPR